MHHAWYFLVFLFIGFSANAATVANVKGKNVLINLQNESVEKGQRVELFDDSGKKRGIIQITRVNKNGTKAVGRLIVGRALKGWTTDSGRDATIASPSTTSSGKKLRYGALLGFSIDSMKVQNVKLSGTGYAAKGIFDFTFTDSLQLRGKAGAEFFSASGEDKGTGSPVTHKVDITYITAEGLLQYYLNRSKYSFWIGGGGAVMHPASKTLQAKIQEDSITTTSAFQVGAGFDVQTKASYIPIEVIYSMLPKGKEVSANYLTFSIGYMF